MVSIWFLRNRKDEFGWMEMMNSGRTEMELTNPHSCGEPAPFMGQKSQRRDGECGGCLGTTVGFLFDAKWKFSFETRGRGGSRLLNWVFCSRSHGVSLYV